MITLKELMDKLIEQEGLDEAPQVSHNLLYDAILETEKNWRVTRDTEYDYIIMDTYRRNLTEYVDGN